ncbi:putative methyltransferase DDB_G0268948 isoform X2 [Biomphalaria glabrata]|uniref:Methyltransferase DDB_G0268948 isoform X2 n=1 Tax=Biomphalaria glabrata TaxID=6526 RepID=A0A9W3API4_BIOGL|nr:putative methyltransferase DDB_G0268948 isoform X2 [Biomphalaria glabrata]
MSIVDSAEGGHIHIYGSECSQVICDIFDMIVRGLRKVAPVLLNISSTSQSCNLVMSRYCTTNLFTDQKQTQFYAKFRPHYTSEIYNTIVEFCKESHSDFDLAVDVGCGSGQSTIPLTEYFKKVIGVDVSENQIANAAQNAENVTFKVSHAENLDFIQSNTVDLVTVAQALHWLDLEKFFSEVFRLLKPGGSFVTYGYGLFKLEPEAADNVVQHFYGNVLGNYWPEGRKIVEEKYMSITLPFPGWRRNDSLAIVKECTIDEFIGYMGSWSALNEYAKANPDINLLDIVRERLETSLISQTNQKAIKVTWPVFMLMGHTPISR